MPATKAEIVENLLPKDILHQASRIVVNDNGNKVVIVDEPGQNEDKKNTITIVYNISLDAAIASFENTRIMKDFTSGKLKL